MRFLALLSLLILSIPAVHASPRLTPGTLVDLYDGTGVVEPGFIPKFRPWFVAPRKAPKTPDVVAAVLDVNVLPISDLDRQRVVMDMVVEDLRTKYGFVRDMSVEPSIQEQGNRFEILPYPPSQAFVYEVRGFLLASRVRELAKDKAVRRAVVDEAAGTASAQQVILMGFLLQNAGTMLKVPGVAAVGLGWDCLARGEHIHVRPHEPAVVIGAVPGTDASELRQRLVTALPGLTVIRFVLDVRKGSPESALRHPGFEALRGAAAVR